MTTLRKQEKEIARDAVAEFFMPVSRIKNLLKTMLTAKITDEKIIEKIDNLEKKIERLSQENTSLHSDTKNLTYILNEQKYLLQLIGTEKKINILNNKFKDLLLNNDIDKENNDTYLIDLLSNTWDLRTRELEHGGNLTHAASEIGLANIEFLLKSIGRIEKSTPYLFGINKGGSFLATYLAHRMNLHEKYIVKCDYRVDFEKIICEQRQIDGPIAIIDDVTRSGRTIQAVRNYLEQTYPGSKIFSVVLVMANLNSEGQSGDYAKIDYAPWFTKEKDVVLPWSHQPEYEINSEDYFNDIEMDQIVARLTLDRQP